MLAGVAIEAMTKAQQPAPPGRAPGADPWGGPPAAKPAPLPPPPKPARGRASVPSGGKPAPAHRTAAPAPPEIAPQDREGLLMLRAMVAAARADGQVDAAERAQIAGQLDAAGLGPAARDAVLAEFDAATPPEALAREAAADPMLAAQTYAAALAGAVTIEGAERAWLDAFARALRLDRAAAEAIERRIRGG
jgi:uncharacterized membrane protein YebE (DUF533 family)